VAGDAFGGGCAVPDRGRQQMRTDHVTAGENTLLPLDLPGTISGDSAAAIREMDLDDRVDWVSTGGGAALELLEYGDLPGLRALRASKLA